MAFSTRSLCSTPAICLIILISGYSSLSAQTDCPTITQNKGSGGITNWGAQLGANIQVYTVDGGTEETNFTAAQTDQVETAIENMAKDITGNDWDSTTENVDKAPAQPNPATAADVASPVAVVEITTNQQDITNMGCGSASSPASACTSWSSDLNGHTYYSTTLVLSSVVAAGGLEQMMTHEFGHPELGLNDCSGSNCSNSIMNLPVTSSSPTAPTPCDVKYAQTCQCKKG
jgi:hypothetical protein